MKGIGESSQPPLNRPHCTPSCGRRRASGARSAAGNGDRLVMRDEASASHDQHDGQGDEENGEQHQGHRCTPMMWPSLEARAFTPKCSRAIWTTCDGCGRQLGRAHGTLATRICSSRGMIRLVFALSRAPAARRSSAIQCGRRGPMPRSGAQCGHRGGRARSGSSRSRAASGR